VNRRSVLTGLGSSVALSTTGCLSGTLGATADETASETNIALSKTPAQYPTATGDLERFAPTETFGKVNVGSREGVDEAYQPHDVSIWNEAGYAETVVEVADYRSNSKPLERTFEVPTDTALGVSLLEPSLYLVTVSLPSAGSELTLRIPCFAFDCNASSTQFGLFADGAIRSTTGSTLAGCPSPDC
jgi:hypothetical protein